MTLEELRELFRDMKSKDLNPMLCDTEVKRYDTDIPCGPAAICYDDIVETELLPEELMSLQPSFVVPVKGDSMIGAGIETGDMVMVKCEELPNDSDIVLARIDGKYTLKTFFKDDEGGIWLLPQNSKYDPILLNEQMNVRIYGCVTRIIKKSPRMSFRDCSKTIRQYKKMLAKSKKVSQETVDWAIDEIADKVEMGRQWYAVYRPLVEKDVVEEEDYVAFCKLVNRRVPNHPHPPMIVELQRMAVLSFRKPVWQWDPKDAPVTGKRFLAYRKIGLDMLEMLEKPNLC